jgi:hypothetical protein
METLDSIIISGFAGGFLGFLFNEVWKITDDKQQAIVMGAAVGASVQLIVRITGVS